MKRNWWLGCLVAASSMSLIACGGPDAGDEIDSIHAPTTNEYRSGRGHDGDGKDDRKECREEERVCKTIDAYQNRRWAICFKRAVY